MSKIGTNKCFNLIGYAGFKSDLFVTKLENALYGLKIVI